MGDANQYIHIIQKDGPLADLKEKMQNRLAQLHAMLADDPADPFVLYGIALEIYKLAPADGIAKLIALQHSQPNYLPAYYRLADWLLEADEMSLAANYAKQGLALANSIQDAFAAKELQALLTNIEMSQ